MSCYSHTVVARRAVQGGGLITTQDITFSRQYMLLNSVLAPVLCICMICALGMVGGFRYVINMQFNVDNATEYIIQKNLVVLSAQQKFIEEKF